MSTPSQVLKDVNLKITILRIVMTSSLVQGETFGGSCYLHFQDKLKILKARLVKVPPDLPNNTG